MDDIHTTGFPRVRYIHFQNTKDNIYPQSEQTLGKIYTINSNL